MARREARQRVRAVGVARGADRARRDGDPGDRRAGQVGDGAGDPWQRARVRATAGAPMAPDRRSQGERRDRESHAPWKAALSWTPPHPMNAPPTSRLRAMDEQAPIPSRDRGHRALCGAVRRIREARLTVAPRPLSNEAYTTPALGERGGVSSAGQAQSGYCASTPESSGGSSKHSIWCGGAGADAIGGAVGSIPSCSRISHASREAGMKAVTLRWAPHLVQRSTSVANTRRAARSSQASRASPEAFTQGKRSLTVSERLLES